MTPEQPRLSALELPAEAAPPPSEPDEEPAVAVAALPEAALSLPAGAGPEPVTAKPEPATERPVFDLEPIAVQPRIASVAAAAPQPPPAPPAPASTPDDAETDDFLLAPLPLPGTSSAPVSDKPADPLAPLRTLSAHELIALFT
jgi:hypothetical protein